MRITGAKSAGFLSFRGLHHSVYLIRNIVVAGDATGFRRTKRLRLAPEKGEVSSTIGIRRVPNLRCISATSVAPSIPGICMSRMPSSIA
jgi:hypothetical protein